MADDGLPPARCGSRAHTRANRSARGPLLAAVALPAALVATALPAPAAETAPAPDAAPATNTPGPAPDAAAPAALDYAFDPAVSEQVVTDFVDDTVVDGPNEAEDRAAFGELADLDTLRRLFRETFESDGWSPTNLADASAYAVLIGFTVLDGLDATTSAQDEGVRAALREALMEEEIARASDADKQRFAQELVLLTLSVSAQYGRARRDADAAVMEETRENARLLLDDFGIDPEQFRLGPYGLESGATVPSPAVAGTPAGTPIGTAAGTSAAAADDAASAPSSAPVNPLLPAPSAPPAPAAGAAPVNPLAAAAPPSPFAGSFAGDGVELELAGPAGALAGEIGYRGRRYPATAADAGGRLSGAFVADGTSYAFDAERDGEAVTLETGGARFRLTPR